jgi:hypothetical protein
MVFVPFILLIFFSALHAMEVKDTTTFAIKFNDMVSIEYALRNEYTKNSFFERAKHFDPNALIELKLPTGESIDHDKKNMVLLPLTWLNGTQQFVYFTQLSINQLSYTYRYYNYLQLTDKIKKRVYCHCIVKWFLENAIQHDSELTGSIEKIYQYNIKDFYKIAVPRCYQLFRYYFNSSKTDIACTLNLSDQNIFQKFNLYKTLESFRYMHDEQLSEFFQKQSLKELNQLYNDYDFFKIDKQIKNIIYLYILLKICQKENIAISFSRYITKNAYLQPASEHVKIAKENLRNAFKKYQGNINEDKLMILNSLNDKLWYKKNELNSFERLFLQYIFISKKEQSYCLYISSLNDIHVLKIVCEDLLNKVELLKIDLSPLDSFDKVDTFRQNRSSLPSLKKIELIRFACDAIYLKEIIISFFDKYEKIFDVDNEVYRNNVIFEPVSLYIGNEVSDDIRQPLLHYKNFLLTSFVKKFIKEFLFGELAVGVVSVSIGAFGAPIGHLIFAANNSYTKSETVLQTTLITIYVASAFVQIVLEEARYYTDYPNKYMYSFALSAMALLLFYSYHFYYGNATFRDDFKGIMGSCFIGISVGMACLLNFLFLTNITLDARHNIKELFNILKYKQNVFTL